MSATNSQYEEHKKWEEKIGRELDNAPLRYVLQKMLERYGAQETLATLGDVLKCLESAGNGYRVGDAIELLSQIEW